MENQLSDHPLPTGQVLENVSYGKISGQPSRILDSQGFKTALADFGLREALLAKGINGEKIAEKISVLLEAKGLTDQPDFTAIDKGLKHATAIYGIDPEIPKTKGNTYNFIFSSAVQAKVHEAEDQIANLLKQGHLQENEKTVEVIQERPQKG